jgi:uncharacterized membrane protein
VVIRRCFQGRQLTRFTNARHESSLVLTKPKNRSFPESRLTGVLDRNIETLLKREAEAKQSRPRTARIADAITRFTGSMRFVYLHIAFFGLWIVANIPGVPLPKFDPTFVVLAMWASVEAIFLSTFVLISQNRMAEITDQRADLNLQISLLAEHEVTRLVKLVTAIAARLEIEEAHDPELDELKQDVKPERVLDSLESAKRNHGSE